MDGSLFSPVVQLRNAFELLPGFLRTPIEMVVFGGELPGADISGMRRMADELRARSLELEGHSADIDSLLTHEDSLGETAEKLRETLGSYRKGAAQLGNDVNALADQAQAAANDAEKWLCVMFTFGIHLAWKVYGLLAAAAAAGPAGQVAAAPAVESTLVSGRAEVAVMRANLQRAIQAGGAKAAAQLSGMGPRQFAKWMGTAIALPVGVEVGVQALQVATGDRAAEIIGEDGSNPTGIDLKSIEVAAAAGAGGAAGGMLAGRFAPMVFPQVATSRVAMGLVQGSAGAIGGMGAAFSVAGWPQHYTEVVGPLLNGAFAGGIYAQSARPPAIDGGAPFTPPDAISAGHEANTAAHRPPIEISAESKRAWETARQTWEPAAETANPARERGGPPAEVAGTAAAAQPQSRSGQQASAPANGAGGRAPEGAGTRTPEGAGGRASGSQAAAGAVSSDAAAARPRSEAPASVDRAQADKSASAGREPAPRSVVAAGEISPPPKIPTDARPVGEVPIKAGAGAGEHTAVADGAGNEPSARPRPGTEGDAGSPDARAERASSGGEENATAQRDTTTEQSGQERPESAGRTEADGTETPAVEDRSPSVHDKQSVPTADHDSLAEAAGLPRSDRDRAVDLLIDFHQASAEHVPESQRLSNLPDDVLSAGLHAGDEHQSMLATVELIRRGTISDAVPGGMVLRVEQAEAVYTMKSRPVEMKPGEGKSLVFMATAIQRAVHEGSVLLVTTTDGLANREVVTYEKLLTDFTNKKVMSDFGIDVFRADQENGFGPIREGRPAIVVATGETVGHLCNAGVKPPRHVLIDEMDGIVDRGERQFLRSEGPEQAAPEETAREVFGADEFLTEALTAGALSHEDFGLRRIAEEIGVQADGTPEFMYWYDGQPELTPAGREKVEALPDGQNWLEGMGAARLETAANAEFLVRKGVHYEMDAGKIVIIDQAEHGLQRNPKTSSESRWSAEPGKASLAQAVEAKEIRAAEARGEEAEEHRIVVRADAESAKRIDSVEIYRVGEGSFFDEVTGASGTLTDLNPVLQKIYGLEPAHEIGRSQTHRLVEGQHDVADNTHAKLRTIAEYANEMRDGGAGRFQEILCHRNDLVERQVEALVRAGVPREAIEAVDAKRIVGWGADWEAQLQKVFDEAGEQGKILVINRQGQRGVDISVSDEVKTQGGMHVWMTEAPEQSYIHEQAMNRTARNGQLGSAQVVMSPQDALIRNAMHLSGVREAVIHYEQAVSTHTAAPTLQTHDALVAARESVRELVPELQQRALQHSTADFIRHHAFSTAMPTVTLAEADTGQYRRDDEVDFVRPDGAAERTARLAGLLGIPAPAVAHQITALERDGADDPIRELLRRAGITPAAAEALGQHVDETAPAAARNRATFDDEDALIHLGRLRGRLAEQLGIPIADIDGAEGMRTLDPELTEARDALAAALGYPPAGITPSIARDILGEAVGDHLPAVTTAESDAHHDTVSAAADSGPVGHDRQEAAAPKSDTQNSDVDHGTADDIVAAASQYLALSALLDSVVQFHRRSPNSCVNNAVTGMRVLCPGNAGRFQLPPTRLEGYGREAVRKIFGAGLEETGSLDEVTESLKSRPGGITVLVYKWKNTRANGTSAEADDHMVLLVNDSTSVAEPNLVVVDLAASRDSNTDNDYGPRDLRNRRTLLNKAVGFDDWRREQEVFINRMPAGERRFETIEFDRDGNLAPRSRAQAPDTETLPPEQRPHASSDQVADIESAFVGQPGFGAVTPIRPDAAEEVSNDTRRDEFRLVGSRPHDGPDHITDNPGPTSASARPTANTTPGSAAAASGNPAQPNTPTANNAPPSTSPWKNRAATPPHTGDGPPQSADTAEFDVTVQSDGWFTPSSAAATLLDLDRWYSAEPPRAQAYQQARALFTRFHPAAAHCVGMLVDDRATYDQIAGQTSRTPGEVDDLLQEASAFLAAMASDTRPATDVELLAWLQLRYPSFDDHLHRLSREKPMLWRVVEQVFLHGESIDAAAAAQGGGQARIRGRLREAATAVESWIIEELRPAWSPVPLDNDGFAEWTAQRNSATSNDLKGLAASQEKAWIAYFHWFLLDRTLNETGTVLGMSRSGARNYVEIALNELRGAHFGRIHSGGRPDWLTGAPAADRVPSADDAAAPPPTTTSVERFDQMRRRNPEVFDRIDRLLARRYAQHWHQVFQLAAHERLGPADMVAPLGVSKTRVFNWTRNLRARAVELYSNARPQEVLLRMEWLEAHYGPLDRFVDPLPADQQRVFTACYGEGLGHTTIAEQQQTSRKVVADRMLTAAAAVETAVLREGGDRLIADIPDEDRGLSVWLQEHDPRFANNFDRLRVEHPYLWQVLDRVHAGRTWQVVSDELGLSLPAVGERMAAAQRIMRGYCYEEAHRRLLPAAWLGVAPAGAVSDRVPRPDIGGWLTEYRRESGMNQSEFAGGRYTQRIMRYQSGDRIPRPRYLRDLLDMHNVSPAIARRLLMVFYGGRGVAWYDPAAAFAPQLDESDSITEWLIADRRYLGKTTPQYAGRLNHRAVQYIESGANVPRMRTLRLLAEANGWSSEVLHAAVRKRFEHVPETAEPEEAELFWRLVDTPVDEEQIDEIVGRYLWIVQAVLGRGGYRSRPDYDDIFQICSLGLMRAIKNHAPWGAFVPYAWAFIAMEAWHATREIRFANLNPRDRNLVLAVRAELARLTQSWARNEEHIPDSAVAERLEIAESEVSWVRRVAGVPSSLDEPDAVRESESRGSRLGDDTAQVPFDSVVFGDRVQQALEDLPDPVRARQLVVLHFMRERPLSEVAERIGLSLADVEQLFVQVVDRLRESLADLAAAAQIGPFDDLADEGGSIPGPAENRTGGAPDSIGSRPAHSAADSSSPNSANALNRARGEWITARRDDKGRRDGRAMTAADLARAVGVNRSTMSRIEQGSTRPRPGLFVKIGRALGVPRTELMDAARNLYPAADFDLTPAAYPVDTPGRWLSAMLHDRDMSWGELAEASGTSAEYLSSIGRGGTVPGAAVFLSVCKALDLGREAIDAAAGRFYPGVRIGLDPTAYAPEERGRWLRAVRYDLGMSPEEVAEAAGISTIHLRSIEAGERAPGVVVFLSLCDALSIETDVTGRAAGRFYPEARFDLDRSAYASGEQGLWFRALRYHYRLQRSDVADDTGLTEKYIGQIERGERTPSRRTFRLLGRELGIGPTDLDAAEEHFSASALTNDPGLRFDDLTAGNEAQADLVERQIGQLLDGWSDPAYVREIAEAVGASLRWGHGQISLRVDVDAGAVHVDLVDITGDHSYVRVEWRLGDTPGPVERAAKPFVERSSEELDIERLLEMYGDADETTAGLDPTIVVPTPEEATAPDIAPTTYRVGDTRTAVETRLRAEYPELGDIVDSVKLAISELETNARKHLRRYADEYGLDPDGRLDVDVTGTGPDCKVFLTVTNDVAPGTAVKLPRWTDGEQALDREGGRGTQLIIAESTVAVRHLTFTDSKNTIEHTVEYHRTPPGTDFAITHSRDRIRESVTTGSSALPDSIGSRPSNADPSPPNSRLQYTVRAGDTAQGPSGREGERARTRVVSAERHRLEELLNESFSWLDSDGVDIAVILMSELIANSLADTDGKVEVVITQTDTATERKLRFEVLDESAYTPEIGDMPDEFAERGRGLPMMAIAADDAGITTFDDNSGKSSWFEIHRPLTAIDPSVPTDETTTEEGRPGAPPDSIGSRPWANAADPSSPKNEPSAAAVPVARIRTRLTELQAAEQENSPATERTRRLTEFAHAVEEMEEAAAAMASSRADVDAEARWQSALSTVSSIVAMVEAAARDTDRHAEAVRFLAGLGGPAIGQVHLVYAALFEHMRNVGQYVDEVDDTDEHEFERSARRYESLVQQVDWLDALITVLEHTSPKERSQQYRSLIDAIPHDRLDLSPLQTWLMQEATGSADRSTELEQRAAAVEQRHRTALALIGELDRLLIPTDSRGPAGEVAPAEVHEEELPPAGPAATLRSTDGGAHQELDLGHAAGVTDIGGKSPDQRHQRNQDAFAIATATVSGERMTLAIVTDGVSHSKGGELAAQVGSEAAAEVLARRAMAAEAGAGWDPVTVVTEAVEAAQQAVLDLIATREFAETSDVDSPKATIVAALVTPTQVITDSRGDARAVWISLDDGESRELTEPDTYVGQYMEMFGITEREAMGRPEADKPLTGLGKGWQREWQPPQPQVFEPTGPGIVGLFTDGPIKHLAGSPSNPRSTAESIAEKVAADFTGSGTLLGAAQAYIQGAIAAKQTNDNLTAVLIEGPTDAIGARPDRMPGERDDTATPTPTPWRQQSSRSRSIGAKPTGDANGHDAPASQHRPDGTPWPGKSPAQADTSPSGRGDSAERRSQGSTMLDRAQLGVAAAFSELREQHGERVVRRVFELLGPDTRSLAGSEVTRLRPVAQYINEVVFRIAEARRWPVAAEEDAGTWILDVAQHAIRAWSGLTSMQRRLITDVVTSPRQDLTPVERSAVAAFVESAQAHLPIDAVPAIDEHGQLAPEAASHGLTEHELRLVHMVAAGLSNDAIASRLHRSASRIKFYLKRIGDKLGRHGRAGIVAAARAQGLLSDDHIAVSFQQPSNLMLTPREVSVVAMVADGMSNKAIATQLYLSPLTVKSHLARIGGKLGISDRAAMVARAIHAGFVPAIDGSPIVELSAAEQELLGLVAEGLSNKEIAVLIELSPQQVKGRLDQMGAKLGIRDRAGMVGKALRTESLSLTEAAREFPFGDSLSEAEIGILSLVEQGKTNKQIAAARGISPGTVSTYLIRIGLKLRTSGKEAAVAEVQARGIDLSSGPEDAIGSKPHQPNSLPMLVIQGLNSGVVRSEPLPGAPGVAVERVSFGNGYQCLRETYDDADEAAKQWLLSEIGGAMGAPVAGTYPASDNSAVLYREIVAGRAADVEINGPVVGSPQWEIHHFVTTLSPPEITPGLVVDLPSTDTAANSAGNPTVARNESTGRIGSRPTRTGAGDFDDRPDRAQWSGNKARQNNFSTSMSPEAASPATGAVRTRFGDSIRRQVTTAVDKHIGHGKLTLSAAEKDRLVDEVADDIVVTAGQILPSGPPTDEHIVAAIGGARIHECLRLARCRQGIRAALPDEVRSGPLGQQLAGLGLAELERRLDRSLPDQQRCLVLRHRNGLSVRATARTMGIGVDAVHTLETRGALAIAGAPIIETAPDAEPEHRPARTRRPTADPLALLKVTAAFQHARAAESTGDRAAIHALTATMEQVDNPRHRQVLKLRFLQRMTVPQIAASLDQPCSVGATKQLLRRAVRVLAQQLDAADRGRKVPAPARNAALVAPDGIRAVLGPLARRFRFSKNGRVIFLGGSMVQAEAEEFLGKFLALQPQLTALGAQPWFTATQLRIRQTLAKAPLARYSTPPVSDSTDPVVPLQGLRATVEADGTLRLTVLRSERTPSGQQMFDGMWAEIGHHVRLIAGQWEPNEVLHGNLDTFNSLLLQGHSSQDAAFGTWTGKMAHRRGFTEVTVEIDNDNRSVWALFARPGTSPDGSIGARPQSEPPSAQRLRASALQKLAPNARPEWLTVPDARPPEVDLGSWWNVQLTPAERSAMVHEFPDAVLAMGVELSPETVEAATKQQRRLSHAPAAHPPADSADNDEPEETFYVPSAEELFAGNPVLRDLHPVDAYRDLGGTTGVRMSREEAAALREAGHRYGQRVSGKYKEVHLLGDFAVLNYRAHNDVAVDFALWPLEHRTLQAIARAIPEGIESPFQQVLYVELDEQGRAVFEIQRRIHGEPVHTLADRSVGEALVAIHRLLRRVPVPQELLPLPDDYPEDSVGFFQMLRDYYEQRYQHLRTIPLYRAMFDSSSFPEQLTAGLEAFVPHIRSQRFQLLHGDLTTGNLVRTPRGAIKIVDPGLMVYGPSDYDAAIIWQRKPGGTDHMDNVPLHLRPWIVLLDTVRLLTDVVGLVDEVNTAVPDRDRTYTAAWYVLTVLGGAQINWYGRVHSMPTVTELIDLATEATTSVVRDGDQIGSKPADKPVSDVEAQRARPAGESAAETPYVPQIRELAAELRGFGPSFAYIDDLLRIAEGEQHGSDWIDSADYFDWQLSWLRERSPRLSMLAAFSAAALEAEIIVGLPNASAGRLFVEQSRPLTPDEMLRLYKYRTMQEGTPEQPSGPDIARRSSAIGQVQRELSLDELAQYTYLALLAARPILQVDRDLTRQFLTPAEFEHFEPIPRNGVYGANYPGCRALARELRAYFRARFAGDSLLPAIACRPVYDRFLNHWIEPYQLRHATQLRDGFRGTSSAPEDHVARWFTSVVVAALAAPPDAAPDILDRALRTHLRRRTGISAPADDTLWHFVSNTSELLAGTYDFGHYLQQRNHPETEGYARTVREVVLDRYSPAAVARVPFIANVIGAVPALQRTQRETTPPPRAPESAGPAGKAPNEPTETAIGARPSHSPWSRINRQTVNAESPGVMPTAADSVDETARAEPSDRGGQGDSPIGARPSRDPADQPRTTNRGRSPDPPAQSPWSRTKTGTPGDARTASLPDQFTGSPRSDSIGARPGSDEPENPDLATSAPHDAAAVEPIASAWLPEAVEVAAQLGLPPERITAATVLNAINPIQQIVRILDGPAHRRIADEMGTPELRDWLRERITLAWELHEARENRGQALRIVELNGRLMRMDSDLPDLLGVVQASPDAQRISAAEDRTPATDPVTRATNETVRPPTREVARGTEPTEDLLYEIRRLAVATENRNVTEFVTAVSHFLDATFATGRTLRPTAPEPFTGPTEAEQRSAQAAYRAAGARASAESIFGPAPAPDREMAKRRRIDNWWQRLSPEQQRAVVQDAPEAVQRNGRVPVVAREHSSMANELILRRVVAELSARPSAELDSAERQLLDYARRLWDDLVRAEQRAAPGFAVTLLQFDPENLISLIGYAPADTEIVHSPFWTLRVGPDDFTWVDRLFEPGPGEGVTAAHPGRRRGGQPGHDFDISLGPRGVGGIPQTATDQIATAARAREQFSQWLTTRYEWRSAEGAARAAAAVEAQVRSALVASTGEVRVVARVGGGSHGERGLVVEIIDNNPHTAPAPDTPAPEVDYETGVILLDTTKSTWFLFGESMASPLLPPGVAVYEVLGARALHGFSPDPEFLCARMALHRLGLQPEETPGFEQTHRPPYPQPLPWPPNAVGDITHDPAQGPQPATYAAAIAAHTEQFRAVGLGLAQNAPLTTAHPPGFVTPDEFAWARETGGSEMVRADVHLLRVLRAIKDAVFGVHQTLLTHPDTGQATSGPTDSRLHVTVDLDSHTFRAQLDAETAQEFGLPAEPVGGRWRVRDGLVLAAAWIPQPDGLGPAREGRNGSDPVAIDLEQTQSSPRDAGPPAAGPGARSTESDAIADDTGGTVDPGSATGAEPVLGDIAQVPRARIVGLANLLRERADAEETGAPIDDAGGARPVDILHAEFALPLVLDGVRAEVDVFGDDFLEYASSRVHNAWLQRNWHTAAAEQRLPYLDPDFPQQRREANRDIIRAAREFVVALDSAATHAVSFAECATGAAVAAELHRRHFVEVVGFDLPGLPVESAREYALAIDELLTKYPHVQLHRVGIGPVAGGRIFAKVDNVAGDTANYPYTRSIMLSDSITTSPDVLRSAWSSMVAAGRTAGPADRPIYGLLLREFGDVLNNAGGLRAQDTAQLALAEHVQASSVREMSEWRDSQFRTYGIDRDGEFDPLSAITGAFAAGEHNPATMTQGEKVLYELLTSAAEQSATEYHQRQQLIAEYHPTSPAEQQAKLALVATFGAEYGARLVGADNPGAGLETVQQIIDSIRHMTSAFRTLEVAEIAIAQQSVDSSAQTSSKGIEFNELWVTAPAQMGAAAARGDKRGDPERPFFTTGVHELTHLLRRILTGAQSDIFTVLREYFEKKYGPATDQQFYRWLRAQFAGYAFTAEGKFSSEEAEAEAVVATESVGGTPTEGEQVVRAHLAALDETEARRRG
ncbi:sigma-70 family RNA polymerase sigma factor [Nocardia sp. NPDC058499]|uniref:sigma-70 family RNA polymerase sigma factor n=1 Tax=Nocardia sp. NPDC058499 TaxID=3346530 RepID=UPI0036660735